MQGTTSLALMALIVCSPEAIPVLTIVFFFLLCVCWVGKQDNLKNE